MKKIIHTECLATKRPTERGSALVVALLCLVALFAITFAAKFFVHVEFEDEAVFDETLQVGTDPDHPNGLVRII